MHKKSDHTSEKVALVFLPILTRPKNHFDELEGNLYQYGDAHFRRPDGGNTLQSPFMEGNIMDAFATEVGGEIYLQNNGLFGMLGVTNGMIKGHVDSTFATVADANADRNPSIILNKLIILLIKIIL